MTPKPAACRRCFELAQTTEDVGFLAPSARSDFLYILASHLHEAIRIGLPFDEVVALVQTVPRILERFGGFDGHEKESDSGVYMFWDVVLVGLNGEIGVAGTREGLFEIIALTLMRQLLLGAAELELSARHGLYHLLSVRTREALPADRIHP